MIDPNADLADIRSKWLKFCAVHDDLCLGDLPCCCAREDHRPVIAALVAEVETQRAEVERLNRTAELIQETHTKAMSDSVRECRHLIADRDEARTKLARCREERDEYGGQAATAERENDHLRRERDELLAGLSAHLVDAQDWMARRWHMEADLMAMREEVARQRSRAQAEIDSHRATLGRLIEVGQSESLHQSRREDAEDERDAMRPVVEAAKAWRGTPVNGVNIPAKKPEILALIAAVDQMATPTDPSAP